MNPPLQEIGFITKPFGFKGLLKCEIQVSILNHNNFPEFLWIAIDGKFVPFKIISFENKNEKDLIIEIEDIQNDSEAFMLSGKTIHCEKAIFNKYFKAINELENFIQYKIVDQHLGAIGIVVDFNAQTSQENLIVQCSNNEISIPFVEAIILSVDDEKEIITTNLPDGFLEIF